MLEIPGKGRKLSIDAATSSEHIGCVKNKQTGRETNRLLLAHSKQRRMKLLTYRARMLRSNVRDYAMSSLPTTQTLRRTYRSCSTALADVD